MNLVVRLPSTSSRLMPFPSYLCPATAPRSDQFEQDNIRNSHVRCQHRLDFVLGPNAINNRQGGIECNLIGTSRAKTHVQRRVRGRMTQALEHRMNELQRACSEGVSKPVLVPFFIRMVRV